MLDFKSTASLSAKPRGTLASKASGSWTGAGIRNDAARDEPVPYKEHEDGADSCCDEAGSLVGAIPADRLTDKRREE
jgi:hypothetical protein